MNLHPRHWDNDPVECSGRKRRGNVQSCVGYQLYFGTRGVLLCKLCDVNMVQDAGGVFNMGGKENGGVRGKMGYIYLSSCDFLLQLGRHDHLDSYAVFRWLLNTK
jgi:hypothetical protein